MLNKVIEQRKREIENFLKDNEEHQDKHIDYILVDPETKETYVLASDENEEAIEFTPFTKNNDGGYSNVPEWDFNFDYYIYNLLDEGKQIAYMTDNVHYSIWNSIHELYPTDIEYKDGVQNYLQYCVDNKITKEYLDDKTGFDTPDIMQYFEGLAVNERIEYKGYIIEVDDTNYDNQKEVLVNVYENQQDYADGKSIDIVSLNKIGLKQNIKDYIDESYINTNTVTISQWQYERDSEKSYFAFVLGYDLLHNMINKYGVLECDTNYDFCDYVANQFLDSEEYHNEKYSSYEMLQEWLSKNKDKIEKEYKDTIGFEEKIYNNNLRIIDTGFRKDESIALVEKDVPSMNRKEYIVAFNYTIDEEKNNLSWGYGRYYYDKKSGQEAYKKVINGGNLAFHTRDESR